MSNNIVKDNLTNLKSKKSSNPILIKKKKTPIKNIQNNKNIKDNVINLTSKINPHHVLNKFL
jgi:hypothetical protein